jgi:hypothetical protein
MGEPKVRVRGVGGMAYDVLFIPLDPYLPACDG